MGQLLICHHWYAGNKAYVYHCVNAEVGGYYETNIPTYITVDSGIADKLGYTPLFTCATKQWRIHATFDNYGSMANAPV